MHVSKLRLVPGTSSGCSLARISRHNRKKVLASISFGLTHAGAPDPKPKSLLAGWRAAEGHGAGEKESSLFAGLVSETGPIYLQKQGKLRMSNLTGDRFVWEEGERKIFSISHCNLFLVVVPQLGHLIQISDICG